MANTKETGIPEFHGDVALYRDWRRSVILYHAGQKADNRNLTAPRILALLRGDAWRATERIDPEQLRRKGEEGFTELLALLDGRYGWQPESVLYEALEGYLYFSARRASESITAFIARYHASMEYFMDTINKHRREEARLRHRKEKESRVVATVEWLRKKQLWDAYVEAGDEYVGEGETPEEPEPLAPEPVFREPERFELPNVITGFLLLRKLGLDRKGRAELLRAAKGMELDKLEHVLRTSEAEHFTVHAGARAAMGAYGAEEPIDYAEIEETPEFQEAYVAFLTWYANCEHSVDGDSGSWEQNDSQALYGATAEAEEYWDEYGLDESQPMDLDGAVAEDAYYASLEDGNYNACYNAMLSETADDDPEYSEALDADHSAYYAWKQARQHLDSVRKARGFFPVRRLSKGRGKGRRGKGKGKFGGAKSRGKAKASPQPGAPPRGPSLPPGAPGMPVHGGKGRRGGRTAPGRKGYRPPHFASGGHGFPAAHGHQYGAFALEASFETLAPSSGSSTALSGGYNAQTKVRGGSRPE